MNVSVQSIYNWYRDLIRNPKYRWWVVIGSALYLLSPFDISPDFLPIIGWIDDGVIATLLVAELSQFVLERLNAKTARSGQPAEAEAAPSGAKTETLDVDAVSVDS